MSEQPFTSPPAENANVLARGRWIVEFLGQFIERCRETLISDFYHDDSNDDECFVERLPDEVKTAAPGLLTQAANALVGFEKIWQFSSKPTGEAFVNCLRVTGTKIRENGCFSISRLKKYLHEMENAVARLPDGAEGVSRVSGDPQTPAPASSAAAEKIPNPSAPFSLKEIAEAWGGSMTAKKLKPMIGKAIRGKCLNRQTWIISLDDVPAAAKKKLAPTPPNSV